MTATTPVLMRICELLEDGAWHPIEEVIIETGWVIPPGTAIRANERERAYQSPGGRFQPLPTTRQVQSGRRTIVRQTLKNKYFERDRLGAPHNPPEFVRMVELPPQVVRQRLRLVVESLKKGDMDAFVDGDPAEILTQAGHYSSADVLEIAIELACREKERALAARLLMG